MTHKEYPKMLYLDGKKGVIVENAEEEAKLTKKEPAVKEEKPTGWGK